MLFVVVDSEDFDWLAWLIFLPALPPFGIVIMALDGVFMQVDVNNFFENDVVYTMLLLKTEGGEEDLFLKIPGYV